jgi:hypothetical protein
MSVAGSMDEPYPNAVTSKHTDKGIVKFPVNVHSVLVEHSEMSGQTRLIAKQNEVVLSFILDDTDCRHLAELLSKGLRE